LAVVEELLIEFDVALPKIEPALPEKLTGLVIGATTLASLPMPLPIPKLWSPLPEPIPLPIPPPTPLPAPPPTTVPLLLLLVVSLSCRLLVVVVEPLLTDVLVVSPKKVQELPKPLTGAVTGMVTLASSPLPLPIP